MNKQNNIRNKLIKIEDKGGIAYIGPQNKIHLLYCHVCHTPNYSLSDEKLVCSNCGYNPNNVDYDKNCMIKGVQLSLN